MKSALNQSPLPPLHTSPTLYLYQVEGAKRQQIERLAATIDIKVCHVMPCDYLQPLGALLGLPGFDRLPMRYGGPLLPDEMMVFSGFDDTLLSRFLSSYRQTNIAPIPLKAGVTPNNLFWDTLQLHRELAEEHRRLG